MAVHMHEAERVHLNSWWANVCTAFRGLASNVRAKCSITGAVHTLGIHAERSHLRQSRPA